MATERGMAMPPSVVIQADAQERRRPSESTRLFWLGWIGAFAGIGVAAGMTALIISFLTACDILHENRNLSIAVSSMLIGCLGALLLAAHGMDRLSAIRREREQVRTNLRK